MKFSVIIPCYNSSKTIVHLLDQLNSQPTKDFEVILIDDCSKDNTVNLIQTYQESNNINIRLIQKEKNSGPGISRNLGIQSALGDYLCFIDSDDSISSDYFLSIEKGINQGADIVYYSCVQIRDNKEYPLSFNGFSTIDDYIALCAGSLWLFCSRRELWNGLELPAIKNAEDIAVIPVVMSRASRIITIPNQLYRYVYSSNSLSNTSNPQVCENFLKSFQYTLQYIDKGKFSHALEFHGIKTVLYGATLNALKANVNSKIIKSFWKDFNCNFPLWYENEYIKQYPLKKRVFLYFIKYRLIGMLRLYAALHTYMLKNG